MSFFKIRIGLDSNKTVYDHLCCSKPASGVQIWKFCNPDSIRNFFRLSISNNEKLWTLISNPNPKPLTQLHLPYILVVSILPNEAKGVAILPFVRNDWLKW